MTELLRPDSGEGDRTYVLDAEVGDEKLRRISVSVPEQELSEEEASALLDQAQVELERWVAGMFLCSADCAKGRQPGRSADARNRTAAGSRAQSAASVGSAAGNTGRAACKMAAASGTIWAVDFMSDDSRDRFDFVCI